MLTIAFQSIIAPVPTSPQARAFSMGGRTVTQPSGFDLLHPHSSRRTFSCFSVTGCLHIAVFAAGATKILGFCDLNSPSTMPVVSQALITERRRLSDIPMVILAMVLADSGATSKTCAHLLTSQSAYGLDTSSFRNVLSEFDVQNGISALPGGSPLVFIPINTIYPVDLP